ncbi:protein-L-isoaspartate O-methyltransferase [Actinomadura sp. SCN-SB]|uniref:protein-L-isoaspartate O-methyltransferase family protein n=1 Tax=Actinomadura sp. SCN-SB TaxID=3373092 RepID=UPI003750233F
MSEYEGLPPVDRRFFMPGTVWAYRGGESVPISRDAEPEAWEEAVGADDFVVSRVAADGKPIASSTARPMMAQMLAALRLEAGMRVLEVGTGIGYNAACLAALGAEVVTVEIDRAAADYARGALRAAGYPEVVLIIGDGVEGAPSYAPFDRVIVTAAVHTVPYAWVEQTRPGGLIVVPWAPTIHPDGALATLTVRDDGTAVGRFAAPRRATQPLHGQQLSWDAIYSAYSLWMHWGEPDRSRYGVTVTPDGQDVWLDSPSHPIAFDLD